MAKPLQRLFRRYRAELQAYLQHRVSCPETAADLVQETFLRVMDREAAGRGVRNIRSYLFRTAAELAARHRQQAARQVTPTSLPASEFDTASAEQTALSGEELEILRQAIAELPRQTREIFILHKFEHFSYSEIARQLAISRNRVTVHMARALLHCRQRLAIHRRGDY